MIGIRCVGSPVLTLVGVAGFEFTVRRRVRRGSWYGPHSNDQLPSRYLDVMDHMQLTGGHTPG